MIKSFTISAVPLHWLLAEPAALEVMPYDLIVSNMKFVQMVFFIRTQQSRRVIRTITQTLDACSI